MEDRIDGAFAALLEDMEAPPTWEELGAARVTHKSARTWRPVWALAAGFVAVVALGVSSLIWAGDNAVTTIPYVKLHWSQEVEMRCEGMEIVDNGGFDEATIEIWGPNEDGVIRVDATAADGSIERMIGTLTETGRLDDVRATIDTFENSVFQVTECVMAEERVTRTWSWGEPPIFPDVGLFPSEFVGYPGSADLDALFSAQSHSQRVDSWRGTEVKVYIQVRSERDEFGLNQSREERWVDLDARRQERHVMESDTEELGSLTITIEVETRGEVAVGDGHFSTDGLVVPR